MTRGGLGPAVSCRFGGSFCLSTLELSHPDNACEKSNFGVDGFLDPCQSRKSLTCEMPCLQLRLRLVRGELSEPTVRMELVHKVAPFS